MFYDNYGWTLSHGWLTMYELVDGHIMEQSILIPNNVPNDEIEAFCDTVAYELCHH